MPKNKGKGGKNRRKGKTNDLASRELEFKQDGMEYGQIVKVMGGERFEVYCFDGKKRLGHIRGTMRKKCFVGNGDVILVSLRSYQDDKCDILMKYTPDEVRKLKAYKELPDSLTVEEKEGGDIEFDPTTHAGECDDDCFDEESSSSEDE